jgi:tetratricopeptide (TPR) repeat protein
MCRPLGLVLAFIACVSASCHPPSARTSSPAPSASARSAAHPSAPKNELALGREDLRRSRYARAEAHFRAIASGAEAPEAALGLAEVMLATGRYPEAAALSAKSSNMTPPLRLRAAVVGAAALRAQGKLGEAEARLRVVTADPSARRARLLLGEVLVELGRRKDAEGVLGTLIDDYNTDRIATSDAEGLMLVGRAAHLLRSPRDANDAYNQAERAGAEGAQLLLWRAELFLEAYDPGHAEEVLKELLTVAPEHPEALARMAEVKVAQTYDFQAATDLGERALRTNPRLTLARAVLAGAALRDMELERAERHITAGLAANPRALDLLSLRAAVRFLADDTDGFERGMAKVLALSPGYSRMYGIIGEYAEWEHRYEEIANLMRSAVKLDGEDGKAYGELGLNLIRAGDDRGGVAELAHAIAKDPFNVRVYNTLDLYEKVIPRQYSTVTRGRFTIRYQHDEQAVLDRYVPDWLDRGYRTFEQHYRYTPKTPVGAEIYPDKQHFSIRTSGLPNVGIQGVSFGRTFAALSPRDESFNLGMTLWHELGHVFHIQLSRYHVPRWFTEGLAEYETLLARPEWKREHDLELYQALESGRIPPVEQMNQVFTHARDMTDMTVAYYASSQILVMLGERFGMPTLARMIELWGEGKRTPEVFRVALGQSPSELDAAFRAWLAPRLGRYRGQFLPVRPAASLEQAEAEAKAHPKDARIQAAYGILLLGLGQGERASKVAEEARKLDASQPDVLWLVAQVARARGDGAGAERAIRRLITEGHDGFPTEMALGSLLTEKKDPAGARAALEAAHKFDPSQAEPLAPLAEIAARSGDRQAELEALRGLAALDQHDPIVYQKLLRALLDRKLVAEALEVAAAAIYVDVLGLKTHLLVAEVWDADRKPESARFELESAVLCQGEPTDKAEAHLRLARAYLKAGKRNRAREQATQARRLDADHPGLKDLRL